MKKYIVGLGCSWTQGEGGYSEKVWEDHGGRVQVRGRDDYYLRKMEHENSWVNVLARDHFSDHESVNLGIRGIGNSAAYTQLYFCDKIDWNNSTGIIVFMLSGVERFDYISPSPLNTNKQDDYYSNNIYKHYKYWTLWPFPMNSGQLKGLQDAYALDLYSESFCAMNTLFAVLNAQMWAKSHGYKFVLANSFNHRNADLGFVGWFKQYAPGLFDKVNWNNYIHNFVDYEAFVQLLVRKDGFIPEQDWRGFYEPYSKNTWPTKYLTNCEGAHPTLEGYKEIGKELAQFIKNNAI